MRLAGRINKVRLALQVDVGFGDAVMPNALHAKSKLPGADLDETVALIASLLWPPTQVAVAGTSATALWDARRLHWRATQ